MSVRSAKERLTQHTPVEHHFIQVDQPMSILGMHFYGMGGSFIHCTPAKYSQLYSQLSVCITDRPYRRSAFQIRTWSEFELG